MAGIEVNVTGDFIEKIDALSRKMKNLKPFFKNIGEIMLASTKERMSKEETPEGEKYEALSWNYLKLKRKGTKILQIMGDSGGLKGTLAYHAEADALILGSNKIYAATHQLGDKTRNIPKRSYLGISKQDEKDISNLAEDFLNKI